MKSDPYDLQSAVEKAFNCLPSLNRVERVRETFGGQPAWDGLVHVFDILGDPDTETAYAWTLPIGGSKKRRIYTVLGKPPINSAADAVRSAIAAERAKGGRR